MARYPRSGTGRSESDSAPRSILESKPTQSSEAGANIRRRVPVFVGWVPHFVNAGKVYAAARSAKG